MTNPAKIAKQVARTPKTPEARSPSVKKLPSGARRRTSSMAVIAIASATTTTAMASARFTRPKRPALFSSRALELLSPTSQKAVNCGGADDRLGWERQRRRVEDEGPRLRAAQTAVEGDELLEGAALVELRVVEAADHDVGHVREAVGP